jgi:hypothetical protein
MAMVSARDRAVCAPTDGDYLHDYPRSWTVVAWKSRLTRRDARFTGGSGPDLWDLDRQIGDVEVVGLDKNVFPVCGASAITN